MGFRVHKINFNGGDLLFWHGFSEVNYSDRPQNFLKFIDDFVCTHQITDIVLFGDCRPWHLKAIQTAKSMKLDVWVFEEGYLRPHWITLERGGVNANSSFHFSPDQEKEFDLAKDKNPTIKTESGLKQRVLFDIFYNCANFLLKWKFVHHKTHRPNPILLEYASWIIRLLKLMVNRTQPRKIINKFIAKTEPKYLFPLQLDSDFQLRAHSPFKSMPKAIEFVLKEFATNASKDAIILVKNHPLDNGLINYKSIISNHAKELNLSDRIFYVDGGDLNRILKNVNGVVTINSTVGITALEQNLPVMLLGKSIYGSKELVYTVSDKTFWTDPMPSNPKFIRKFREQLIEECLVNGNFYVKNGITNAVKNSSTRMTDYTSLKS